MRYTTLLITWFLSDLLVFIAAYALAYFLRVGPIFSTDFPFSNFIAITCAVAPLWLGTLISTRAFALTRRQRSLRSGMYIIYAAVMGIALFALGYYFVFGHFFSRLLLLYALALSTIATLGWHIIYDMILRRALRKSPPAFRALIIGVTRESRSLIEQLNHSRSAITPVAVLDGQGTKESEIDGVPVRGKLNVIEDVMREQNITHLIQCADLEQSLNLLSLCRQFQATYMLLPSVLGIVKRDERVESLEGHPVTVVRPSQPLGWFF